MSREMSVANIGNERKLIGLSASKGCRVKLSKTIGTFILSKPIMSGKKIYFLMMFCFQSMNYGAFVKILIIFQVTSMMFCR